MNDDVSISFYNVKEGSVIFLENLRAQQDETDVAKDTAKKIGSSNNSKYLTKLGLF